MNEELRQVADAARDPGSYNWLTYLWVATMSGWGGLVRFLNTMQDQKSWRRAFFNLFVVLATSTFVGVLTFYACELSGFDKLTTAICVAITGHLGVEALNALKSGVLARLRAAWVAAVTPPERNED